MPGLKSALLACTLLLIAAFAKGLGTSRAAGTVTVLVTNSGDSAGFCPSSGQCTLRAAIDFVNTNAAEDTSYLIRFSASAFSAGGTTISVTGSPLPAISAPDVTVDPQGLPIRLSGAALEDVTASGLTLAGDRGTIRGLEVAQFPGACIVLAGSSSLAGGLGAGDGVRAGGCATGIKITGENSQVLGSSVGFTADGGPNPVGTGIEIAASNTGLGPGTGSGEPGANTIGNASVGVRVAGLTTPVEAVSVRANRIGTGADGKAAPVGTGVLVEHLSAGVLIQSNVIANSAFAAIGVAPDAGGTSVNQVAMSGNVFRETAGIAVDLGLDGVNEPNDPDDSDTGPNGLQNHPVITRAVAGQVSGLVAGCSQCTVEIYTARHSPGAVFDADFEPLAGMVGQTSRDGTFTISGPGPDPGVWVAGLATGPDGTSEFGPSARTGAGSVNCAPTFLVAGWNHAAYLGQPVSLGVEFPSSGDAGAVTAIYELADGEGSFRRWFPGGGPGRTLSQLVPGAAYWFYAERPVQLPGGFSFTSPIRVPLVEGWNDFIYLGATGNLHDVFREVSMLHGGPYRFEAGGEGAWQWGGSAETPAWATDFADLIACSAYYVHFADAGTLIPLQP